MGMAAFVYDGIFVGLTATRGMLVASSFATCLFFAVFVLMHDYVGNHGLWVAYLCFLSGRGMVQYAIFKRKIIAKL